MPFIPPVRNTNRLTIAQCGACLHWKSVEAYYERRDRPDYARSRWSNHCRDCMKRLALEKYRADPERARARRLANIYRQKCRNGHSTAREIAQAREAKRRRREAAAAHRMTINVFRRENPRLRYTIQEWRERQEQATATHKARVAQGAVAAAEAARERQQQVQAVEQERQEARRVAQVLRGRNPSTMTPSELQDALRALLHARDAEE